MQLGQVTNVLERQESLTADSARVLTDGADTLNASANRQRKTASRANGSANVLDRQSANNRKRNKGKNKRVKVKSHKRRIFESQPFLTPVRANFGSILPANGSTVAPITRNDTISNTANNNCHTYLFNIGRASGDVSVNLNGLRSGATVRVVRDINSNGIVDKGDVIESRFGNNFSAASFSLNRLEAGSYFVQVYKNGTGDTAYSLGLSAIDSVKEDPANNDATVTVKGNLNRAFVSSLNNVNNSNTRDTYQFRVDSRSNVQASLIGTNLERTRVTILDGQGRIVGTNQELTSSSATLAAGTYTARVEKTAAGSTDYNLQLRGTPIEGNRVRISVQSATARDQFDSSFFEDSRADFYSRVKIGNFPEVRSQTFVNNNSPFMNFNEQREIVLGQRTVSIDLKLFDDDGVLPDEEANINPNTSQKSLRITYDIATGDIRVNGVNATFQRGRVIELTGQGSGKKATVRFRVDHD